jgi:penicillin-binding protein-related factor A (putative recombinase)
LWAFGVGGVGKETKKNKKDIYLVGIEDHQWGHLREIEEVRKCVFKRANGKRRRLQVHIQTQIRRH